MDTCGRHHRLNRASGYRYICPTLGYQEGLASFYGSDRSFCLGTLFDTTDIIVEFKIRDWTDINPITHHPNAYRGPLTTGNCVITAILYHDPPVDYSIKEYALHIRQIEQQVPTGTLFYQYYTDDSCSDMTMIAFKHVFQKK
jgi:hypothetical protein